MVLIAVVGVAAVVAAAVPVVAVGNFDFLEADCEVIAVVGLYYC